MSTEHAAASDNTFNVVTWNVLLDKTKTKARLIAPQSARLDSQINTLLELDLDTIDVAMIQEAEKVTETRETEEIHCGEEMARALGYHAGFWFEHNTSRRGGDHIGVFGAQVYDAEKFALPHDKLAVITMIGETAVVGIHFRKERIGPMRIDQAEALIERMEGMEHVVLVGDPNALAIQKPRRLLHQAGFESAFHLIGQRNPKTHPTPEYRKIFYPPIHRPLLPRGTASDIIYVRGMEVHNAFRFHGDSDHYGLAAQVSPTLAA